MPTASRTTSTFRGTHSNTDSKRWNLVSGLTGGGILAAPWSIDKSVIYGWTDSTSLSSLQGHWGGIWEVPRSYSFVSKENRQTLVELKTKFDNWQYADRGIEQRMPWVANGSLTTSEDGNENAFGTVAGIHIYECLVPLLLPSPS